MTPPLRAIIPSSTARVQLIMPHRLSWISLSHSSRVFSVKSASRVQPTLLTSTSTPPNRSSTARTIATTSGHVVTSVRIACAFAPNDSASAATFLPCFSSISAMVTWARSRAKARLMARPMFEPPPVTITLLPARFRSMPMPPPPASVSRDPVLHPHVGVLVASAIRLAVDDDGLQRPGHDIGAAVGERHAGPLLPLADGPRDHQRTRDHPDDLGAEPPVGADPRVERRAVGPRPAYEALHRRQRVGGLERGTHGRQQGVEPVLPRNSR